MKNTPSAKSILLPEAIHLFLDEAGDTTFYGKGKIPILGSAGVSNYFLLGMLKINDEPDVVRKKVIHLQNSIIMDPYFQGIPSIIRKKDKTGYFLHAKDDLPEIRKMVFDLINSIDCDFDCVIGKKRYDVYEKKHNGNQAEFYADMLSNLLQQNMHNHRHDKVILNVAHRSRCTTHTNLQKGLQKAIQIARNKFPESNFPEQTVFNIQYPTSEPIINLADYFLWAIQRKIEKGERRFIDFIGNRIRNMLSLYGDEDIDK